MNSGGEPERDDTGLPPVDIEIPDDARELERDMQAYYRELKALRRHRRNSRLRGVLARDGMIVPLLVCSLVFALVAGTLLTLFTATSIDNQTLPGTAGTHPKAPSSGVSAPATNGADGTAGAPGANSLPLSVVPGWVPHARMTIGGKAVILDSLRPSMLLVVPANCNCDPAILSLARLARNSRARAYLVATPSAVSQAGRFADRLGGGLSPAVDGSGTLGRLNLQGLAAVFVSPGGAVTSSQLLQDSKQLTTIVRDAFA